MKRTPTANASVPAVTVRMGSTAVRVSSSHERVLRAVNSMFPELVEGPTTPLPSTAQVQSLSVEGGEEVGRSRFVVCNGQSTEQLDWPTLVVHLEHLLAQRLLAGRSDRFHLHAAGVGVGGYGLLLLGPSGAGKSTMAFELMRTGAQLLGDDVVLLDGAGVAEAFPRRPKLDVVQARRLGVDPARTILWHSGADECWLDPRSWSGWSPPMRISLVVTLRFCSGAPLELQPLDASETASQLMAALFPSGLRTSNPELESDLVVGLAGRCPAAALTFGEGCDAASALRAWIDDSRAPRGMPVVD